MAYSCTKIDSNNILTFVNFKENDTQVFSRMLCTFYLKEAKKGRTKMSPLEEIWEIQVLGIWHLLRKSREERK